MNELLQHQQELATSYTVGHAELEQLHQNTMRYKTTKKRNDEGVNIILDIICAYQKAAVISDYILIENKCKQVLACYTFARPGDVITCVRLLRLVQWRLNQMRTHKLSNAQA